MYGLETRYRDWNFNRDGRRSLAELRYVVDHGSRRKPGEPMTVACPYIVVHPAAKAAFDRYAPHTRYFDVSGSSYRYHDVIRELWAECEDFILVEHDIEISAEIIEALETCPQKWCSVPDTLGADCAYLQCNRFRRELMVESQVLGSTGLGLQHWIGLDGHLMDSVQRFCGVRAHVHSDLTTIHHRAENKLAISELAAK